MLPVETEQVVSEDKLLVEDIAYLYKLSTAFSDLSHLGLSKDLIPIFHKCES